MSPWQDFDSVLARVELEPSFFFFFCNYGFKTWSRAYFHKLLKLFDDFESKVCWKADSNYFVRPDDLPLCCLLLAVIRLRFHPNVSKISMTIVCLQWKTAYKFFFDLAERRVHFWMLFLAEICLPQIIQHFCILYFETVIRNKFFGRVTLKLRFLKSDPTKNWAIALALMALS